MIPRGHDSTRIENEVYRHKDATDENFDDIMRFYKQVLTEDKMLCDRAQRNLDAGVCVNGELHPEKEKVSFILLSAYFFCCFEGTLICGY